MMAGLPFGIGFCLEFMALLNYLTDLYASQAASASAASTTTRSILAVALPFCAEPMYSKLGVHWASSLLGFIALLLAAVPWVFWQWGETIRGWSKAGIMEGTQRRKVEDVEERRRT